MNNVNKYEIERDAEIVLKYNQMKEEALASRNGSKYFEACNSLGITPEDNDLYEAGLAELIYNKKPSGLENIANNASSVNNTKNVSSPAKRIGKRFVGKETYTDFLKEASAYIRTDFRDYPAAKTKILRTYFPRFRSGGKQDLRNYDNVKIGSVFKHLYDTYLKR